MHVGFVAEGVPSPVTAGGPLANWAILKCLRESGHRVTACVLIPPVDRESPEGRDDRITALSDLDVHVALLTIPAIVSRARAQQQNIRAGWIQRFRRLRTGPTPSLIDFYPSIALAPELGRILERARPDAIYVFDYGPVAALQDLTVAPRMASLGDPLHLVWRYQLRLTRSRVSRSHLLNGLVYLRSANMLPKLIIRMLSKYESVGWFAAHHASWLRDNGVKCVYLHVPVVDMAGPEWEQRRVANNRTRKPRILMLGHLRSTANLVGLYPFADQTLPVLEQRLGMDKFEVHIVGRYSPPPDLMRKLIRPSVHLRGYVEDIATEFFPADLFLMPSPYPVGVRSRVLMALSFGMCVVTHRSSALGIPELVHEENCLLASDGRELAEHVIRALGDDVLRQRVGRNARATYERYFAPERAGAAIVAELERIAEERRRGQPHGA